MAPNLRACDATPNNTFDNQIADDKVGIVPAFDYSDSNKNTIMTLSIAELNVMTTAPSHYVKGEIDGDQPAVVDTEKDCKRVDTPSSTPLCTIGTSEHRRKRDVVRQISLRLYMKGKDIAEDMIRNVVPQRVEDTEEVCANIFSSLEHKIAPSRKTRKHLWQPQTQDDSILIRGTPIETITERMKHKDHQEVKNFFLSRVIDPTSYFYRFHYDDYRHLTPQKAEVQLVDITWLKPHEEIVSWERVNGLKRATISWDAFTEPLLVDVKTGAILDGHHRYNVGLQLRLKQVPAVLVDYLGDSTITVDVWAGCGRTQLTKVEVIEMSLSPHVFPPKTSRHRFTESLPPISIPLSVLRQNPAPIEDIIRNTLASILPPPSSSALSAKGSVEPASSPEMELEEIVENEELEPSSRLRRVSISLICGAQNLATSVTKSLFRSRMRKIDDHASETHLDVMKRPPTLKATSDDFFSVIRENDPTSSFCKQKSATFEDLLSSDASRREKFYTTRVCDPTSYFYKYHFDTPAKREPKKVAMKLASIKWLKQHEHVVSWDRVEGLRRATAQWDAYLEPLLVDVVTGAILDGHHRYHVGVQLGLEAVPCVLVDYLADDSITVDVWPNCGRDSLTKQEVIDMSLSPDVFPPKTSRHKLSDDLPPISVPLERLRVPMTDNFCDV